MARARLEMRWPTSPTGRPYPRVYAKASFGRSPGRVECILDTGAPFPVLLWRLWDGVSAVRAAVDLDPLPASLPTLDIAGRRYSYRWGRLPITLHDWASGPPLPVVTVLCQLCVARLETPAERADPRLRKPDLPAPVLGLGGGLFDGRYLTLTPGPAPAAWVQDVPPAP